MLNEKDYCDYDTCVALKELGYNQYTSLRSYAGKGGVRLWDFDGEPNYKEGELIALSDMYDIPIDGIEIAAPSLYEAQKWLRENHGIHIIIDRFGKDYNWFIKKKGSMVYDYESADFEDYIDYEGALLAGIKIAIKILKEEK